MKKQLYLVLILCAYVLAPSISFAAVVLETKAEQAIVIDYNTGSVLFEKNADKQMPTSSMSKVMTMYMVFEALKDGRISLDDTFKVSEKAWRKGGSKMFVPVGKQVKIEDLIRGVIIQSGNDATIVLAEGLAGNEDNFANSLNTKALELGMNNSHFMNASGWPDPDHYSSARDLATLAKAMINNFPEYYGYYSEKEFTYSDITQANRNPLLYKNIGADGLKTGHTEIGGYGLIGTGVKDGRRVIIIINGLQSEKDRVLESTKILQWGLNEFRAITLFENGQNLDHADVYLGKSGTVGLVAEEAVSLTIAKSLEKDLDVSVSYSSPLTAPIQKGQEVGTVTITVPNGEVITVPLVAAEAVEEMPYWQKIIASARLLATGEGFLN